MLKRRLISLALSFTMIVCTLASVTVVGATADGNAAAKADVVETMSESGVVEAAATPVIKRFKSDLATFAANGGRENATTEVFRFVDGADMNIAAYFGEDTMTVDREFVTTYMNYIGGTNTTDHPTASGITLEAGEYKIYYLGHSKANVNVTLGSVFADEESCTELAKGSANTLYVHTMTVTLAEALTDGTMAFNSTAGWLPDFYGAVLANTAADPLPEAQVAALSFDASAIEGAEGTVPSDIVVDKGGKATVPANKTLYVNGKTLSSWTDGTNNYAPGDLITMSENKTVTPVFVDNTADISGTVTFNLGPANGAPNLALQGNKGILVAQTSDGIDVKLDIDATNGKCNNSGRTDVWAQVNGGTKFSVSAIKNSVVTVGDIWDDKGVYTINGVEKTGDNGSEKMVAEGTCDIVAGATSGSYWSSISVTYPVEQPPGTPGPTADHNSKVILTQESSGTERSFETIRDAVESAVALDPQSKEEEIVINVKPGDYEEQVVFPSGAKFITLQQEPNTSGGVNLHWYYCTGYCAGTADLNGNYDPTLNWNDPRTWKGYNDVNENGEVIANNEEDFTEYRVGQVLSSGTKISYYTSDGQVHKDVACTTGHLGGNRGLDQIAALITKKGATDITVKDFNIVNSIPVMVTAGEKAAGVAPEEDRNADHATSYVLPRRDNLVICSEDTAEATNSAIDAAFKVEDDASKVKALEALTELTPENSAYLARSGKYNERGHAVSSNGDRIYFENIRLRGNQDSLYVSNGRNYFKNCDLIGGTDYIYGDAICVFDNCKLGLAGFSNQSYGSPVAVPGTQSDMKYGYLFWNCTMYNMRENNGENNFGGSWGDDAQVTYYKTTFDDNASVGKSKFVLASKGWGRFNAELGLNRLYEYGSKNISGAAVDLSERVVNKSIEEGGPGMGTVIDEWQILEYNPRNYFSANNFKDGSTKHRWTDDWDPMNFGETYLKEVDAAIAGATVTVPEGEETEIDLPTAPSGIEFKWESASSNAVVTSDGKLQVIRPAAGEAAIETKITLYAMNTGTKYGDKKKVPVTINATTDVENVFSIPVEVAQSTEGANDYTVTLTKDGALIKQQVISVAADAKTATATIENIPVGEYDVKVVSKSDEFTVVYPEDGACKVSGAKGESKILTIGASKLVDETVNLDISYASKTDKNKAYDLIALAKAKGANGIDTSDSITVGYTLNLNNAATTGGSFIDLVSGTPTDSVKNGALNSRYVLAKLGHWTQLDMVDCSQGYSGSSDGDGQGLNMSGKFAVGTPNVITTTIDFKNSVVSVTGNGTATKSKTFANFPTNYTRNDVKMSIYVGPEDFTITDVSVTYKKVVGGDLPLPSDKPQPTPTDEPTPTTPADIYSLKSAKFSEDNKTLIIDYTAPENTTAKVMVATYEDESEETMIKSGQFDLKNGGSLAYEKPDNGITKVFIWDGTTNIKPLCNAIYAAAGSAYSVDFTQLSAVPVYSAESGQGFVSVSGAIRAPGYERKVADTNQISISPTGASVTESNGAYLYEQTNNNDGGDYNRGGLIYRIDTGAPGAYHIEVEVLDASNTTVAPTGMEAGRLTGINNWDNCGQVPRTVSASWSGNVWSYDFATGEDFVEIEIEPSKVPTAEAPQTVGVKSIKLTPLAVNVAGDKPTIHILGDSTQKAYSFNETISSWGQTLKNYFDLSKVNVVNYSMGGRAMKSNYNEGRFDEILISGKQGDYVFIHSAHNDETVSKNRFSRGSGIEKDLAKNNESYNTWLDMYMNAIKARGMTPVLVTAMPRTGGGKYSEDPASKPNGFNPDSPGNMRAKAKSDSEIGLVELYEGAKKYINSLDAAEVEYIYNSIEAGETPAKNSANGAKGDGTHYREAAAKQWCRIILQSIYDQANAATDTYTDKAIMQQLVSYMSANVTEAAASGNWSAVFPEMASDVSAVGVVPGATKQAKNNYYYRTSIEKALQLGALHKNSANEFKPTQTITVGEFARGMETVFGLPENSLTNYTRTYAELRGEVTSASAASSEDASEIAYAASEDAQVNAAAGEITVTVQQPTGGSVKIYNESQHTTKTTDITDGVTSNQVLDDNKYYKLTAPAKIANNKEDKNGKFPTNSAISTTYFEFRKADDKNGDKEVYYDAKASGTLTLYMMFDNTKAITLENITDGTKLDTYIEGEKADSANRNTAVYNTVTFNVEAGKSYKTYCNGGTGRLFGVMYEAEYPQSDSSLSVSAGDKIKVVAGADDGYVLDGITVNGEKKTSKREYTFEVSDSTTVSALFTKEPEVVENAAVASDAALTREVMGAIMYDAYNMANKTIISLYIAQNGGIPSPDDPNYDPNLTYEGTPYIPLTGWGALTDTDGLNMDLYAKVKAAYNLGLIRSEQGIKRGAVACGDKLEPTVEVTRAKAAKALVFCYTLTQPLNDESQLIPGGINHAAELAADIIEPNAAAPKTPIIK